MISASFRGGCRGRSKARIVPTRMHLGSAKPIGRAVADITFLEIVGIAEATVKTRMFYARKKLAEVVATA
jgi:hypothetical protein